VLSASATASPMTLVPRSRCISGLALTQHSDDLGRFDRWLKGADNESREEPLVRLFVISTNRWVRGTPTPSRPPISAVTTATLISAGVSTPVRDVPPDTYTYDPAAPTLTLTRSLSRVRTLRPYAPRSARATPIGS
jgi:hypothetical protein